MFQPPTPTGLTARLTGSTTYVQLLQLPNAPTFDVHRASESLEVGAPEVKEVHDSMFVTVEHEVSRPPEKPGELRVLPPEIPLKI